MHALRDWLIKSVDREWGHAMVSTSPAGSGLSAEQMAAAIAQVSSAATVDSPFGPLEFFDGVPRPDTVSTAYDALDLMRGIDVFLNAVPGASLVAMRRGLRSAGVTSARIIGFTDPRANSRSLFLTPNTETTYGTTFLDLKAWGPTVIEAPPDSLCVVDDFWFRYVADMGIAGPDRGQGGKYLFLPPGYDGEVPACSNFRSGGIVNIRLHIAQKARAEPHSGLVFICEGLYA